MEPDEGGNGAEPQTEPIAEGNSLQQIVSSQKQLERNQVTHLHLRKHAQSSRSWPTVQIFDVIPFRQYRGSS